MGVYITGMEMPTNEYGSMTITIYPNGSVAEYIGDIGRILGPLIPVPPHGRLIDADAMCSDLATVDPRYEIMIDWCIRVTQSQPTIIPAEEGET